MEITIAEFKEQYLPALQEQFHKKTSGSILQRKEEINQRLVKQMEGFVRFMGSFQQEIPADIGEIQIALLQTSVYLKRPQIAVSAYDEKGIFGNEILNIKYDASWLFAEWDSYKEAIEAQIRQIHVESSIRSSAVRQMMWESMNFLVQCLYAATKYVFMEFEQMEGYEKLLLAENFRLSVGSYRDWSRILYMKRPAVDIFFHEKGIPLPYCAFQGAVYNRKAFEGLDLTHTRFTDCEFVHSSFSNVLLRDAVFVNCRFYYCSFEKTDFCGASFRNVTVKKSTFRETGWHFIPDMEHPEKITDIYKPVSFSGCVLESLSFETSDLRGITGQENTVGEIKRQDCESSGGIFEEVSE